MYSEETYLEFIATGFLEPVRSGADNGLVSWERTIPTDDLHIAVVHVEKKTSCILSVVSNTSEIERGAYPSIRPPNGFVLVESGGGGGGATGGGSFTAGREDEDMIEVLMVEKLKLIDEKKMEEGTR